MRRLLVGFQEGDQTGVLENIVYLELRRRGYDVYVGKVGDQEVDFVAVKEGIPHYFQVTYSLTEKKTIDREFDALMSIRDNHPKTVLSLDTFRGTHLSGIGRKNLIDWLLE